MMLVVGHSITALSPSKGDDTHRGFVPLIYPLTKTFKNATGRFFLGFTSFLVNFVFLFYYFVLKNSLSIPPPQKKKEVNHFSSE